MEVEEVKSQSVESLWNLAIKRLVISLQSSIDHLGKNELNPIYPNSLWWSMSQAKDLFLNSKHVQALIEYHKPHREYLSSMNRIDDYKRLLRETAPNLSRDYDGMMYWLCFENCFSNQLRFTGAAKDQIILAYLEKNDIKLSKCKIFALRINFEDVHQKPWVDDSISKYELIKDTLARMPKLEDLRLQVCSCLTDGKNLRQQLMTEILPRYQLKALKILLFDERSVRELGCFIRNSSRQLEQMEICFPGDPQNPYSNIHDMIYLLLKSLTKLQKLKMLNLDLDSVQFSKQEMENSLIDRNIHSVKKMKIWIHDFNLLKMLDKCFNDIQILAISCPPRNTGHKEMTNLQRLTLEKSLLSTSMFQNVTNLLIDHLEVLPIRMVTIWKIFPNLREFTTFTMIIEDEDFNEFPVAHKLEKLTVYFGEISPKLFERMPNLKQFIIREEMSKVPELVSNIEPFLPSNCKLSITKVWEIFPRERGAPWPIDTLRI